MDTGQDRDRLLQSTILDEFRNDLPINEMATVYLSKGQPLGNYALYCALIALEKADKVLSVPTWDLEHGDGLPGTVESYQGGERIVEYLPHGGRRGVEPLIIDRKFYGMRDNYVEIAEEFRLFHRLFHDKKSDQYIKIDDDGSECLVAVVEPNTVKIRLKEIRQFLAIKEMYLSIQFDYREFSELSLEDLGLEEGGSDQHEGLMSWGFHLSNSDGIGGYKSFSRLLGKRLIEPLPKSKSGFFAFAEEPARQYVDFIIDVDKNGDEVLHTSNHLELLDNYLTPVYFSKQVLDKYYHQPSKYSVKDSLLSCGYLWSMDIDNHHDDKVCAWLGDLGQHLPYEDQLHWKAHNIPPKGKISETFYRRQIMALATNSDRPEHLFNHRYLELKKACEESLGWPILLPLNAEDEHHLHGVRIPATNEQRDFDELVLSLTKILVDSLNEKQLNQIIPAEKRKDIKGSIARLEVSFLERGIQDYSDHITFLRNLQNLRSSSSAHRKGGNYSKIAKDFGVESQNLQTVFAGILTKSINFLEFLLGVVVSGNLEGG